MIAEYEGTAPARRFVYGPGIDEPVMMVDEATGSRYYYYYDGLGSVAALSHTNGTIAEQYRYDAFGKTRVYNGSGGEITDPALFCGNPYMFTARRLDPETRTGSRTGLYYYRARVYAPELGRFMQTDPIGYYDSMNLYQYAFNSPANYLDPYGLSSKSTETDNIPWWRTVGFVVTNIDVQVYAPLTRGFFGGGGGEAMIWLPLGYTEDGKPIGILKGLADMSLYNTLGIAPFGSIKHYVYPQGGLGSPGGSAMVGGGLVFDIYKHSQYKGPYINGSVSTPMTPYGAFGLSISSYKGSPTAVQFMWGASSGGISGTRQEYYYPEDVIKNMLGNNQ